MITDKFLEDFYANIILPRYSNIIDVDDIEWVSHGKIDLDAWAHYFISNNIEYVLLIEDFPGNTYLHDGLTHEIVANDDVKSFELKFSDNKSVENINGWYALFVEKNRT